MTALLRRVGRLFTAKTHALVDRFDDPDAVVRHALRELNEKRGCRKRHLLNALVAEKQLAGRLAEHENALADVKVRVMRIFQTGDEVAVKRLLRRQLHHQDAMAALMPAHTQACRLSANLKTHMARMDARLAELEQRYAILNARAVGRAACAAMREADVDLREFLHADELLERVGTDLRAMDARLSEAEFREQAERELGDEEYAASDSEKTRIESMLAELRESCC